MDVAATIRQLVVQCFLCCSSSKICRKRTFVTGRLIGKDAPDCVYCERHSRIRRQSKVPHLLQR